MCPFAPTSLPPANAQGGAAPLVFGADDGRGDDIHNVLKLSLSCDCGVLNHAAASTSVGFSTYQIVGSDADQKSAFAAVDVDAGQRLCFPAGRSGSVCGCRTARYRRPDSRWAVGNLRRTGDGLAANRPCQVLVGDLAVAMLQANQRLPASSSSSTMV